MAILEIAEFTAAPGQADALATGLARGVEVIRTAEGCLDAHWARAVENGDECILFIHWRAIEDHLQTFRNGPLFSAYRQHINGLFVDQPRVRHYPLD
jgi:quinol monooxygenase YgiN